MRPPTATQSSTAESQGIISAPAAERANCPMFRAVNGHRGANWPKNFLEWRTRDKIMSKGVARKANRSSGACRVTRFGVRGNVSWSMLPGQPERPFFAAAAARVGLAEALCLAADSRPVPGGIAGNGRGACRSGMGGASDAVTEISEELRNGSTSPARRERLTTAV
jgi:hypothetical protein